MKKMLGLVWSILGLFVFSLLFFLFLNGMLMPKPPFVRAAKGYLAPDSLRATTEQESKKISDDREGSLDDLPQSSESAAVEVASAPDAPTEDTSPGLPDEEQTAAHASATPSEAASSQDSTEDTPVDDLSPFDPEKMSRLVRVYEKMRPKQVGLILDTMPDAQSVAVLGSMKDRSAAQVMAAMEPSKAARMSQLLVERGQQ